MPTLTKRLTATATIRSKIETDITTISSFALIPAQIINGTQLKIHRTTPIPTDIVNFPEKPFFFSLTMPSTPYSVSISSLPRNSYLEDSLPLKINRNTATATITRSIATPIPLAKSSVIPILLLSLKPIRAINGAADATHKDTPNAMIGDVLVLIRKNSSASSIVTFRSFLELSVLLKPSTFSASSISSFNK